MFNICPDVNPQVALLTLTLLHFLHYLHRSAVTMETVELLQRHNYSRVDVGRLASWEQVGLRQEVVNN